MRHVARAFLGTLVVYVFVYAILSAGGKYQVSLVDINRVEGYSWAPMGFYDPSHPWAHSLDAKLHPGKTGGWNDTLMVAFFPLYAVDILWIHKNYLPRSASDRPPQ